jgi:hypothetical protein
LNDSDERSGLMTSLEQNQCLLNESKNRESDLLGKMTAMESQIKSLVSAKEEVGETASQLTIVAMCVLAAHQEAADIRVNH